MVNNRIHGTIHCRMPFSRQSLLFLLVSIFFYIGSIHVSAQTLPLPYLINNASEFSDAEIYVGLVGKIDDTDVWIDMVTGDIKVMQSSDNTLLGPIHNGNYGPGGDGKYADIFTPLSAIPDNTINIPQIYAARIFIAFESPLYMYFFGDGGGYSAPSWSNDSDANLGLKYELIELTYGDNGLQTNTTRIDAYQYPMGLEVWGSDGFYKRVGEVLTHDDILNQWRSQVSDAFQDSLDEEMGIILNPSKSLAFQEGEAYNNYFSGYVDAVWARYEAEDMQLSIGETGVWLGRVIAGQFIFTNQNDATVGIIAAKPNTLEILAARGVLAEDVQSTPSIDADKNIQKHFSAAFNRGAIDLDAATDELIEWSELSTYFGANTHNEYVAFWHADDISYKGESYAFAFDDVFDYSATIQSTVPEKVTITIGGFVNNVYVAPESIDVTAFTGGSGDDTFYLGAAAAVDFISLGDGDNTIYISPGAAIVHIWGGLGVNTLAIGAVSTNLGTLGIKIGINSASSVLFEANLLPLTVDNPTVIWHSSDETVATVTNGLVTAVATGSAVITLSSHDNTVSETILVAVNGVDYRNETTIHIEAENYRDMYGIEIQTTTDDNGTENVGSIDVGDYIDYQVNIATAGEYTLAYRIASLIGDSAVEVLVAGESVLNTQLNTTGSWHTWQTQTDTLTLPAGDITLRLLATGDNWHLNWLELTLNQPAETTGTDAEQANSWQVTATGTGLVIGTGTVGDIGFTSFENLVGGTGDDIVTIGGANIGCQSASNVTISAADTSVELIDCTGFDTITETTDTITLTGGGDNIIQGDNTAEFIIDNDIKSGDELNEIPTPEVANNSAQPENITPDNEINAATDTNNTEQLQDENKQGGTIGLVIFSLLTLRLWRQKKVNSNLVH